MAASFRCARVPKREQRERKLSCARGDAKLRRGRDSDVSVGQLWTVTVISATRFAVQTESGVLGYMRAPVALAEGTLLGAHWHARRPEAKPPLAALAANRPRHRGGSEAVETV